jgi:hypothetical protein
MLHSYDVLLFIFASGGDIRKVEGEFVRPDEKYRSSFERARQPPPFYGSLSVCRQGTASAVPYSLRGTTALAAEGLSLFRPRVEAGKSARLTSGAEARVRQA